MGSHLLRVWPLRLWAHQDASELVCQLLLFRLGVRPPHVRRRSLDHDAPSPPRHRHPRLLLPFLAAGSGTSRPGKPSRRSTRTSELVKKDEEGDASLPAMALPGALILVLREVAAACHA